MVGIGLVAAVLAVVLASPAFAGGWAVVTLDRLPQGVRAGEAVTVGFTVRQHGLTPVSDLVPPPSIDATNPATGETVRSVAEADGGAGHYTARLVLPSGGEWTWGIRAFGDQVQPMPPMQVAAANRPEDGVGASSLALAALFLAAGLAVLGIVFALRRRAAFAMAAIVLAAVIAAVSFAVDEPAPPVAEAAGPPTPYNEGQALFVAKGCVVCHVNRHVPESENLSISIGPELSLYRNAPDFLSRWLADPAAVRPTTTMPDLGLTPGEIEALIAFLNGEGTG
jgi:cytochrome c2